MDKDALKGLDELEIPVEPTYLQWKKMGERMNVSYGTAPAGGVQASSERLTVNVEQAIKKKKEDLLKALEPCKSISADLKQSQEFLAQVYQAIDSMNRYSDLYLSDLGYNFTEAGKACQLLQNLASPPKKEECPQCAAESGAPLFNGATVSLDIAKLMLRSPTDRDQYLLDQLKSQIQDYYLTPGSPGNDECTGYDPFATAKQIEKLLKNSCVRNVYVPDRWLITKFNDEKNRVIYRPFLTDDRYSIELVDEACQGSGSAASAKSSLGR
jgi:hypothetical protein